MSINFKGVPSMGGGYVRTSSQPLVQINKEKNEITVKTKTQGKWRYPVQLENQAAWKRLHTTHVEDYSPTKKYKLTVMAASDLFIKRATQDMDILAKRINSISLITESKNATFLTLKGGFVVDLPGSCVFSASKRDAFSRNISEFDELKRDDNTLMAMEAIRMNTNEGILTPKELIQNSIKTKINEIVAIGSSDLIAGLSKYRVAVGIEGVFMKIDEQTWKSLNTEKAKYGLNAMAKPMTKTSVNNLKKVKGWQRPSEATRHTFYLLGKLAHTHNLPFIHINAPGVK